MSEEKYYVQDARQHVGNCVLWWGKDRQGYTCDLDRAHVFTKEEAFAQMRRRSTDKAWPKAMIDAKSYRHFDMQLLKDIP